VSRNLVGVVNVVFLDSKPFVKPELADHLVDAIARRENLENDLGRDSPFAPLQV
jgi:hypothetical protein